MRIAAAAVAGAVAVTLAILGPPDVAEAAFPGDNGRIAYRDSGDVPGLAASGIFTILPDGSARSRVVGGSAFDIDPSWSADGRWLVFVRSEAGRRSLFIINADGGGLTRVAGIEELEASPSFSPDGRRILYTQGSAIRTIGVDGTDPRRVLRSNAAIGSARYSPNGRRIAFAGAPRRAPNKLGIWTMRSDGSRLRRRTSSRHDGSPEYSPDGRHIAFVRYRRGQLLIVMRADGSRKRRIVDDEFVYGRPAFAPAGDRIAYQRGSVPVSFEGSACSDIFTVSLDGTDRRNVTRDCFPARTSDVNVSSPSWQPLPG